MVGGHTPQLIGLTMSLQDGDLRMRVRDVLTCPYGVLVLLPQDGMSFLPKPGTELTLSWADKQESVYYPGIAFELDALRCLALVFVSKKG